MEATRLTKYPFAFDPQIPFIQQASDWIADVFYEFLPEAGFEVRDEQIYMAFQLERAYSEKRTIFAEAGVGTGKTLVYLLYAVMYARYTRKPAVIACADESLIEQLVKPEGDIAKLAQHLGLSIDARLSKSPDQYICLQKLDTVRFDDDAARYRDMYEGLPNFVRKPDTLQSFHPYGNRKDYPELTDVQWGKVGWDVFQDCFVCSQRHRCGQTLSREHYRKSEDIIICSHDFYMEHIWTYDSRKRKGQLPLLPEHSSVVFDEGHLLETAAQSALTYKLKHGLFESIVVRLLQGQVRESLAVAVEEAITQSDELFAWLDRHSRAVPGSDRREIPLTEELLEAVRQFRVRLDKIEEELVFESEMYTLEAYQLTIVEEHLEMLQIALHLFTRPDQLISWVAEDQDGLILVMMPKQVKEVLKEQLFMKRMPIVFSSATLSVQGAFHYMAEGLGLSDYLSFSVPSPYNYEEQMQIKLYPDMPFEEQARVAMQLLQVSEGRALLLFPSREELDRFRIMTVSETYAGAFRFLFEGESEISHLISEFQTDEHSVLCAVSLWEGLDIPGPSLSQVLVWSLPFPPNDPVFAARRQDASEPFEQVDMPYMLLRLRQGIGRLIRTREDRGTIAIFGKELQSAYVMEQVVAMLPAREERVGW
jgi:ATP-dependent DNA helicase DinG